MAEVDEAQIARLFNGWHMGGPICIGRIPHHVQTALAWRSDQVFLTLQTAQKIRFFQDHPLDFRYTKFISFLVEHGEILQDRDRDVIFYDHIPWLSNSFLYLVGRIDGNHTGIYVRTMYKMEPRGMRRRIKGATLLRRKMIEAA